MEPSTFEGVQRLGSQPRSWFSQTSGLFSDQPHIGLYETHFDPAQAAAVERYYIIDAASGSVERIAATTQAYTEESLSTLLQACGFSQVTFYPGMGEDTDQADFFAVTAQAGSATL